MTFFSYTTLEMIRRHVFSKHEVQLIFLFLRTKPLNPSLSLLLHSQSPSLQLHHCFIREKVLYLARYTKSILFVAVSPPATNSSLRFHRLTLPRDPSKYKERNKCQKAYCQLNNTLVNTSWTSVAYFHWAKDITSTTLGWFQKFEKGMTHCSALCFTLHAQKRLHQHLYFHDMNYSAKLIESLHLNCFISFKCPCVLAQNFD